MSGLSSDQTMLSRVLQHPELIDCMLIDCMMERMGVKAADAVRVDGGMAWLEAHTKCIFCRHVGKCCDWLEGLDTRSTPAEFCPNYQFFRSCAEHSPAGAVVASYGDERT